MDSIDYLLLAMIVFCLFQVSSLLYKYRALDSWVRTDAQPVESSAETYGKGYKNGKMPLFQISALAVKYEYWVKKQKYVGRTQLKQGGSRILPYSFEVYYNPSQPEMSVVEKRRPWGPISFWFLGAVAAGVALFGWRRFKLSHAKP